MTMTPAGMWDQGFGLGNGDLGASHYFVENEAIYGINKYGVRGQRFFLRFET